MCVQIYYKDDIQCSKGMMYKLLFQKEDAQFLVSSSN